MLRLLRPHFNTLLYTFTFPWSNPHTTFLHHKQPYLQSSHSLYNHSRPPQTSFLSFLCIRFSPMATMLNEATIMGGILLLIAANESEPQTFHSKTPTTTTMKPKERVT